MFINIDVDLSKQFKGSSWSNWRRWSCP